MSPEDNQKIAADGAETPEQIAEALKKSIEVETPEEVAERMVGDEPEPGSIEREKAVREHVKRVAAITAKHTGSTPAEIERILEMPHPECDCDNPQPKSAHTTVICGNCGGICVGAASKKMKEAIAEALRARAATTPNPDDYELDSLGRKPVVFNKSAKTPIKCMRCEAEGKLVYAGYAPRSKKIFCPTGRHTKIPREARFTQSFMRRKRRKKAQA